MFTALIDWLVWDHRPTLATYLGMALVIGGGLVAVRRKAGAPAGAPDLVSAMTGAVGELKGDRT